MLGTRRCAGCFAVKSPFPLADEWDGQGEITEYIVSKNLHRRHLDASQRALIAAQIARLPLGSNQHTEGTQKCAPSQQQAADLMNVSLRLVQSAKEVLTAGDDDLQREVQQGKTSVTAAVARVRGEKRPAGARKPESCPDAHITPGTLVKLLDLLHKVKKITDDNMSCCPWITLRRLVNEAVEIADRGCLK